MDQAKSQDSQITPIGGQMKITPPNLIESMTETSLMTDSDLSTDNPTPNLKQNNSLQHQHPQKLEQCFEPIKSDHQTKQSDIQLNLSESNKDGRVACQEHEDDMVKLNSWKRPERDILRECRNNSDNRTSMNATPQAASEGSVGGSGINYINTIIISDRDNIVSQLDLSPPVNPVGDELISIGGSKRHSSGLSFADLADTTTTTRNTSPQKSVGNSTVRLNLSPTVLQQQNVPILEPTTSIIDQQNLDNQRKVKTKNSAHSTVIQEVHEFLTTPGASGLDTTSGNSLLDRPSSSEFVDCDNESPKHAPAIHRQPLLDKLNLEASDLETHEQEIDGDDYTSESDSDEDHRQAGRQHKARSGSKYVSISKLGNKRRRYNPKVTSANNRFSGGILNRLKTTFSFSDSNQTATQYLAYEDKDLLTGSRKYSVGRRKLNSNRTFRGSYRYNRVGIGMAIINKLSNFIFRRSTAALFGAFLIHITLGTVYTLSNINSYLTSYMRKHGYPEATYGSSMWISSSYAVGQGISMVLGGYIEKRFSARVSCILGCATHSLAIMSTSKAIEHGPLAILLTYGFLPGFGCGLAYMTPMSNGFGWFPNRRGLVAGTILAGFGIGTFVFNMAQTAYVNPENLSPPENAAGYFTQKSILDRVPQLFIFIGSIYAIMQFIGCCLLFKPPDYGGNGKLADERPILAENEISLKRAVRTREFIVLFLVFGTTNQGVLFVNAMLKEYGQIFIGNDMYLAWTGSMASIANSLGRLLWGLAIDRFSFTQCFSCITVVFGTLMFIMPFEFILSSKLLYLLATLGIFGSFSGWMSTYPVHISRVFGRSNSGMIYGLIFVSQAIGGIFTALGAHYLIDHYSRFVPFFCVTILELIGLTIYHLFYPK